MRPALDLIRPLGPSSQAYLSLHSSEATQAKTFCVHSSPAPTQIKPQPAPAIPGQESVHTTLSITHQTKERPSTGPRTLRSSNSTNGAFIYLKYRVWKRVQGWMEQSLFSRERGFDQSSCSSNTHIFHGMLSFAKRLVPAHLWLAAWFLVGKQGGKAKDMLGSMG
jgi:hypothetical protein